jgi:hypothetical protein
MADTGSSRWRLTEKESKDGLIAAVQMASNFVVPGFGPLLVWGASIIFERRRELYNAVFKPFQAINLEGERQELTGIGQYVNGMPIADLLSPRRQVISFRADLTKSAREAGLRWGDPVSVVIGNQNFTSTKGGLVVPARIGESVDVTVPQGDYSLAAFGSKRESLFVARNPYTAIGGSNVSQAKRQEVELPLRNWNLILVPKQSPQFCRWCGQSYSSSVVAHVLICPQSPLLRACDKCGQKFMGEQALKDHQATAHPIVLSSYTCPFCKRTVIGFFFSCRQLPGADLNKD